MKKYRYEYVRVGTEISLLRPDEIKRHKETIDEYAANGWRYAGNIPVIQSSQGRIFQLDLIFEQEIE